MCDKTQQSFLWDECKKNGFDLTHTFHTCWYNDLIEKEGHVKSGVLNRLPCPTATITSTSSSTIESASDTEGGVKDTSTKFHNYNAFLIGNTKTIWPFFIEWLSSRTKLNSQQGGGQHNEEEEDVVLLEKNPFDAFCKDMITDIVENFYGNCSLLDEDDDCTCFDVFLSSGKRYKMIPVREGSVDTGASADVGTNTKRKLQVLEEENDFLVSMQRIAILTGSYWYDDAGSKLCVHPKYGTWHAFRAVVVVSTETKSLSSSLSVTGDQPVAPPPPVIPCPITQGEIDDCTKMMDYALRMSSSDHSSNSDGMNTIHNLEIRHETKTRLLENFTLEKVSKKLTPTTLGWIGLRDAISLGRDNYRYDKEQLCYHYTRDAEILKNVLLTK